MIAVAIKLLDGLIAFLRHPVGQLVAGVLIFGGLAWWHGEARYRDGAAAVRAAWQADLGAQSVHDRQIAAQQAVAGAAVGAAVAERQAQVRTVTQTLIKEVPIYVTAEADARCDVPAGFVRLHDAAAAGVSAAADPAGRPADAASGLALSTIAETVTDNYGVCHGAVEQVRGWQMWWAAVSAANSADRARP